MFHSTNTHSRRKFRGKSWGKAVIVCPGSSNYSEGVQAVRASELVGYGGSSRDTVDKLTFRVYSSIFLGENQVLPRLSQLGWPKVPLQ